MYVSDTEDDIELSSLPTHDHVLEVSPSALAKVFVKIGFQIGALYSCDTMDHIKAEINIVFKVPKHLVPRKWSNKCQAGAIRISSAHLIKPYRGLTVDPFSDWSRTFYRHKVNESKTLQRGRRNKTKWEQRKIALYHHNTEVSGINPVKDSPVFSTF